MLDLLQNAAIEYIIFPIISTAITAIIGWAAFQYQKWTGQQIEEKKKRDLHQAAENAVRWAIQMFLNGKAPTTAEERDKVLVEAPAYMADKVPGALEHFKLNPSGETVMDILRTKLPIPGLDTVKK